MPFKPIRLQKHSKQPLVADKLFMGIILAICHGCRSIFGGVQRIAKVSEVIVPSVSRGLRVSGRLSDCR